MLGVKLVELNNKIKSLDQLSSDELILLVEEAKTIISTYEDEFVDELSKRKIYNKIRFMHTYLRDPLSKIQGFDIKEKNIIFLDEKNKPKKIKKKNISAMMEMYFFIHPNDELFNILGLYFNQPQNYFIFHLYDQLS